MQIGVRQTVWCPCGPSPGYRAMGTGEESTDMWEGHSVSTSGEGGNAGRLVRQPPRNHQEQTGEVLSAMAIFPFLLGDWSQRRSMLGHSGCASGKRQYMPWFLRGPQLVATAVWTCLRGVCKSPHAPACPTPVEGYAKELARWDAPCQTPPVCKPTGREARLALMG